MDWNTWEIRRRGDGAVVVQVPSREVDGQRLPDAVFAFRAGDPQYHLWDERLRERQCLEPVLQGRE
jgi:hypothetical protein